jgi:hypothetical protein
MMNPTAGYQRARSLLHERFGNEFTVTQAWIDKVADGQPIKSTDGSALETFADTLRSCSEILASMGKLGEIDNQRTLSKIVAKLPLYLQNRWRKLAVEQAHAIGSYPTLQRLVRFVGSAAREKTDPVYGTLGDAVSSKPDTRNRGKDQSRRVGSSHSTNAKAVQQNTKETPRVSGYVSLAEFRVNQASMPDVQR